MMDFMNGLQDQATKMMEAYGITEEEIDGYVEEYEPVVERVVMARDDYYDVDVRDTKGRLLSTTLSFYQMDDVVTAYWLFFCRKNLSREDAICDLYHVDKNAYDKAYKVAHAYLRDLGYIKVDENGKETLIFDRTNQPSKIPEEVKT